MDRRLEMPFERDEGSSCKKRVELRTAEHPILFVGRLRIVNSSFNIEHQIVTLNNDRDCK